MLGARVPRAPECRRLWIWHVIDKTKQSLFTNHLIVSQAVAMMFVQEVDTSNKDPVPVIVVGNKVDLTAHRTVSYQEGKKVGLCTHIKSMFTSVTSGRLFAPLYI